MAFDPARQCCAHPRKSHTSIGWKPCRECACVSYWKQPTIPRPKKPRDAFGRRPK